MTFGEENVAQHRSQRSSRRRSEHGRTHRVSERTRIKDQTVNRSQSTWRTSPPSNTHTHTQCHHRAVVGLLCGAPLGPSDGHPEGGASAGGVFFREERDCFPERLVENVAAEPPGSGSSACSRCQRPAAAPAWPHRQV